jgi:5-formyltetrahydrofolate cyclo-ligase
MSTSHLNTPGAGAMEHSRDAVDTGNTSDPGRRAGKESLRRHMRAARAAIGVRQRAIASSAIGERLMDVFMAWQLERPLFSVAVYLAKNDEASMDAVAEALMRRGVLVVAPRGSLVQGAPFYALRGLYGGVRLGSFGVREPVEYKGGMALEARDVQIILTPGLAFDRAGGRLGFGGGWYDRVLQGAGVDRGDRSAPIAIGVCFDCQVVEEVPREEHDQRVSLVVTETQTIDADGRLALKLKR